MRDCRSTTSTDHRKKWWRCTVHKLCLPSLYRPSRSLQNLNIKLLKKDDDTVLKLDLIYRPSQNGQNKCNIEKMTNIVKDYKIIEINDDDAIGPLKLCSWGMQKSKLLNKLSLTSLYRPSRSLQNLSAKLLKKRNDAVLKLDLIYRPSKNGQNKCNIEKMTIIRPDMLSKITKLMQYWNKWRQCSRPTQIM